MTEPEPQQHVILCEGFDDRSFWAGWLLHRGCTDPSDGGNRQVLDGWGLPVTRGRYLFETASGSKILVQPCRGKSNLGRAAKEYLAGQDRSPSRMIINQDSDADQFGALAAVRAVRGIVERHGGRAIGDSGRSFAAGDVQIDAVIWETDDAADLEGVPKQQTLERLVAASIQAAHPGRGNAVAAWLRAEPVAPMSHKTFGYSYLAKWYADFGADDFFRAIWREEPVAEQLRVRLELSGAWAAVERLVAG